ncbi:MAG: hypothetical protein J5662_01635 [Clostridia bacterium]|nr:hypothetical protein [Clostridia bacterium]
MAANKLPTNSRMKNTAPKPVGYKEPKRGEFYCCSCGKKYPRQQGYFPTGRSAIYKGNNGYLPVCKECFEALYLHYYDVLKNEVDAVERVCQKFDIYFSMPLVESALADSTDKAVIMTYISRISLPQFKNKTYDTTIDEDEYEAAVRERERSQEPTEEDLLERRLKETGMREWGLDLTVEEYAFLDKEFADWNARCNIEGKTRESLVRDLCVQGLQKKKALDNNDADTYNKLSITYQKTLQAAELTPKQIEDAEKATEKPMGVMIKMFESEDPIPKPDPEWEDVDGIMKYILVYFIGHLCKMLGLKNKYSNLYEEEMEKYAVSVPEDVRDGDSEDIFDYLLENGFGVASSDNTESDEAEQPEGESDG